MQKSTPHMTGRPGHQTTEMNGGSSASHLARTPCVPLFSTLFTRGGNKRVFRIPGEGGDHFHCAVDPSPGHFRCRKRCFGPRAKGLLHHLNLVLHRCNPILHRCNRPLAHIHQSTVAPSLSHFWQFQGFGPL